MSPSDKFAVLNMATTFVAVLIAPIIALWVAVKVQGRLALRQEKMKLLGILLSSRHQPLSPDAIRSLNLIDAVFARDHAVREAWTRYNAALSDQQNNNPAGFSKREEKRHELILAMIGAVGLQRYISLADVLRTYLPMYISKLDEVTFIELEIRHAEARKRAKELKLPGYSDPAA
jgi:hypothetical protein